MTNQIVSVRIPKSLNDKVKQYALNHHYMDVSEVVRSLLRKKWIEHRDPYSYKVKTIKTDIMKKINSLSEKKKYKAILTELDHIKEEVAKKMGERNV